LPLDTWPTTSPVSRPKAHSVFRHWRWIVGVGCVIAPIIVLWMMATRIANNPARTSASAPPAVSPEGPAATKPAVAVPDVVPAATKPTVAVPAPLPSPPLPTQQSASATAQLGKSAHHAREVAAAPTSRHSRVAARDTGPLGRHAGRSALDRGAPALAPPPAATAGSSKKSEPLAPAATGSPAKSKLPRAGGLSADDF
jgi:hypothetical protein